MEVDNRLTISEAADAIHGWHLDDKGKHVIDESVECLVGEHSPGEVGDRLELVVDEQLWSHGDETLGPGEKKNKERRERREGKKEGEEKGREGGEE